MADWEDELTQEMLDYLDGLVATGDYRDRGDALRSVLRKAMEADKKAEEDEDDETIDTGGDVVIQLNNPGD